MYNDFMQIELWKDCRAGCDFCFNKGQKDIDKIESCIFAKNIIKDTNYTQIGLIGGEFFDTQLSNQEVRTSFYDIFEACAEKRTNNKLNKLYLATSLMYDADKFLYPFMDFLKSINLLDVTLLCTSYDFKYRFKSEKQLRNWYQNMYNLYNKYGVSLHTEIIATQYFVDFFLQDKFIPSKFKKQFNTEIDYIEPSCGFYYKDKKEMNKYLPGFFPTRDSFISLLYKNIESKQINLCKFLDMHIRADEVYCILDQQRICLKNRHKEGVTIPQQLNIKYDTGYIDSDIPMRDDVVTVLNTTGE